MHLDLEQPLVLRLLADDLTGALDTAAQFTALLGPVPVRWDADMRGTSSFAMDSATRETSAVVAAAKVSEFASMLVLQPGVLAYKKLDSLLRGHEAVEIDACIRAIRPAHCIIASAFPFQHRFTLEGRQYFRSEAGIQMLSTDLAGQLAECGHRISKCRPGDSVPSGISIWDAESDLDLAAIADAGRAAGGSVLWCGSSGLAGALANSPSPNLAQQPLKRPVLGLFGSNHSVTVAQLGRCGPVHIRVADGGAETVARISHHLQQDGVALASFSFPIGTDAATAAARIADEMARLVENIDPPRTLIVAGGETLRALCIALGARQLDVQGQILPGVPRAIMQGGRFDGVEVISKSGAFGGPTLLLDLIGGTAAFVEGA
jgi:uncharacterized protein YgbK (DUF1537 family)